jgi:hypothetical protein
MQRGQPVSGFDQFAANYVVRTSASKIIDGVFIGNKEAALVRNPIIYLMIKY